MICITRKEQNSDTAPKKPKSHLPVIALIFGLTPIFWWLRHVPILGNIFGLLFIFSYFGIIFQLIGLILGVIALLQFRKKHIGVKGLVFSFIAFIAPFVWVFILALGVWDYIFSYK